MRSRLAAFALLLLTSDAFAALPRIVLIGGAKSDGPARHDYANGVRVLRAILESSPDLRGRITVDAYPDGWPRPEALEGAATMVWYFDGEAKHPLLDPARRAAVEALVRRGIGIVALHQASTVPAADTTVGLERWLGAARHGLFDRATQEARIVPAQHAVTRGAKRFTYHDEFYPTFRRAGAGGTYRVVLSTTLRPEYRDGRDLADARPERATVAWTFERDGGGRAFTYSGAHYLAALDQPELRRILLNAIAWTAGVEVPARGVASALPDAAATLARAITDSPTFHRDAARSGWNPHEARLTPERLASGPFGLVWESPPLDAADGQPPRLYASPLYLDHVRIAPRGRAAETRPVVIAASNAGFVYAIAAFDSRAAKAGEILWRTRLGAPCRLQPAPLDGVPTGILSTPVADVARNRLYVTHCDADRRWQAYALDLRDGSLVRGWPVRLDEPALNAVNANAGTPVPPRRRHDFRVQRAALNLSPGGEWLYVGFGETETGWIASIDTARARLASAFATQAMPHRGAGGVWGAGGPAVDARGHVYAVTGTGYGGFVDRERDWTQSVLAFAHDAKGFTLRGTYTPFNYCITATNDIDLGSGGAALLTDPPLLVLGGKQGNAYLLDPARMPGRLDRRPPCSDDSSSDASLLPPDPQPQFGKRGPLNVFGPYSEKDAAMDIARARSVPASFRDDEGRTHVFMTGNTKAAEGSPASVPPSLVRLEVARDPSPHLRVAARELRHAFGNPGSPFVTSNGGREAIVWVLDENAPRSALLSGPDAPRPVLYAFEALGLGLLWKTGPGELHTSGKYNQPAFARGRVFVGTDRIQAFGLGGGRVPADVPAAIAEPLRAEPVTSHGPVDGGALYRQRCAACHDDPQGNVPPRAVIARRSKEHVVETLTRGAMRPFALGLDRAAIEAIAEHLR